MVMICKWELCGERVEDEAEYCSERHALLDAPNAELVDEEEVEAWAEILAG